MTPTYLVLKKCCAEKEVLNVWHECSHRDDVKKVFDKAISMFLPDHIEETLEQSALCPSKKIQEFSLIQIFVNGSVEIAKGGAKITISTDDYQCMEMVENPDNEEYFMGLSVIICDNNQGKLFADT